MSISCGVDVLVADFGNYILAEAESKRIAENAARNQRDYHGTANDYE